MRFLNYDKLKIGLFALAMALLFFASILHKPATFSESENRYLAEMPKITTKALLDGSFMKEYETYIVDQFPNRDFFTGVKTLSERVRGKKEDSGVYFGKDGYLFGKYDTKLFESEMAKRNKAILIQFAKKYQTDLPDSKLQIALIPSSSEILKEKLPDLAPIYNQTAWIQEMREAIGEDTVMDSVTTLTKHKEEYIYYRTDHHWTTLGAFYLYQDIAKRFSLPQREVKDFKKEEIREAFLGTYDSKVNTKISGGVRSDTITLYSTPDMENVVMTLDENEKKVHKGIYMREYLEKKDKYSVFMGGNHSVTDIETGADSQRSLLVIKDSFAHSLVPFLLEDYNRVVMVDLRHFNRSLKKFVNKNNFTDILVLYSTADFVEDNNIAKLLR